MASSSSAAGAWCWSATSTARRTTGARSVRFGPTTLHNMYSVTKSVVALVYGVALGENKVPPPEAPLYEQFPEYPDLIAADARRGALTVGHALTMTLGLAWDEIGLPYDDLRNDEIGM